MSSFPYRNEEYRDELVKFAHPFDEISVLEDDGVYIGTDLLLDAVLFFKTAVELPVRIGRIDGSAGERGDFRLVLYDDTDTEVAECLVTDGETRFSVYNLDGVHVGALIFEQAGLQRFSGTVDGHVYELGSDTAVFSLDVTHVARAAHGMYVATDAGAAAGSVRIVARHGVRFVEDAGVVHLDVLSDDQVSDAIRPVISINGVSQPSIWLGHQPECNVRISTSARGIRFDAVEDNV